MLREHNDKPIALPHKLAYLVVAIVCIAIGFAGLILPIIPGFLFILAAIYCLSKVSRRFRYWAEENETLRRLQRNLRLNLARLERVDFLTKVKATSLMSIAFVARSIETGVNLFKRALRQ